MVSSALARAPGECIYAPSARRVNKSLSIDAIIAWAPWHRDVTLRFFDRTRSDSRPRYPELLRDVLERLGAVVGSGSAGHAGHVVTNTYLCSRRRRFRPSCDDRYIQRARIDAHAARAAVGCLRAAANVQSRVSDVQ